MQRKILIVITTEFVPYGGLTTVVMNYYRAIDKSNLKIDIASTNKAPKTLLKELRENGSDYYYLGKRKNVLVYTERLLKVLRNQYNAIHVNGNSATMVLELLPSWLMKVPIRIAHVHNTETEHPIINKLVYPLFQKSFNVAIAVSSAAGDWLFRNNYIILNNAIDVPYYLYDDKKREEIRSRYGITEKQFVLGNIGKLSLQKNQSFLLTVYARIKERIKDSKLMIIGGGPLKQQLYEQAKQLGIEKDVIFTGMVDDACGFFQAFDFFAFPSIFEGLGLALIEAQASGLRCVISDKIPKEAIVTDQVKVLPLERQYDLWADYIVDNLKYDRNKNSENASLTIRDHGYDIRYMANDLKQIYLRT